MQSGKPVYWRVSIRSQRLSREILLYPPDKKCVFLGFNPLPAVKPGDTIIPDSIGPGRYVSIRSQRLSREILNVASDCRPITLFQSAPSG